VGASVFLTQQAQPEERQLRSIEVLRELFPDGVPVEDLEKAYRVKTKLDSVLEGTTATEPEHRGEQVITMPRRPMSGHTAKLRGRPRSQPGSQREVILAELKKRTGTANEVASRTKIPLTAARSVLSTLKSTNRVRIASSVMVGKKSRSIYAPA
jgi:hypothetical protein